MSLEITKQRVIITIKRVTLVFDVEKVAYELSGLFAIVGAPQADNDSSSPPGNFNKNVFLTQRFHWNLLYSYSKFIN